MGCAFGCLIGYIKDYTVWHNCGTKAYYGLKTLISYGLKTLMVQKSFVMYSLKTVILKI